MFLNLLFPDDCAAKERCFGMENFILCLPKLNPLICLRINRPSGVLIIKNFMAENRKRETIAVGGLTCNLYFRTEFLWL